MNALNADILGALFVITCLILAYTSYTDVKKRTINSFIFLPVVAIGAWFNISDGAPLYFIVLGVLVFLATYLETDLVIYPIIGMVFMAVSLYFTATGSIYYGFTSIIISLMFLIGFQERLFGIGDVKAMVALFFAFTRLPFLTSLTAQQTFVASIMPISMMMLFNIAIVSMLFIPYLIILNSRSGKRLGVYSMTARGYDEKIYSGNEAKYNIRETSSGKIMVYKTPFMVSVAVGFIITMLAGFWFLFI